MPKPLIALVGRPNVGKSTLFNRMIGERTAIVEDLPGTTRDRLYGEFDWRGRDVAVVDTGGIVPGSGEEIEESIFDQARLAIEEADVIVFLVDRKSGVTPVDEDIADLLRRTSKPVILAVNKADNVRQEAQAVEFHELGLGDPVPFSALRGIGTGDLLDVIWRDLPPPGEEAEEEEEAARVAIVGRPNVGKSSLVNALTGKKRTIVSPVPGTTRDAIDTEVDFGGRRIILVDTAGIRRRGKIGTGIERYSVVRAMRAVDRADVAVLLIDATEPIAAQDAHVAGFIQEHGKGLVVAVNKWDLIEKESHTMAQYERLIREELKFMPYVPIVFISAKSGQRIENVLNLALAIEQERRKRIPTGILNDTLRRALNTHQSPSFRGRQVKLLYVTQVAIDPPTFVVKVNEASQIHFSYQRFLENRLREQFGFFGTPIKIFVRGREGRERAS